jgi:tetratricopeptide (TPR) repeat protein
MNPGAVLLALCPMLAIGPQAAPEDPQQAHELAVASYRAGDFESAQTLWLAALESDAGQTPVLERARILYNLGNAAYRAKRPLEAVGWYTAALALKPRYEDASANLEFVRGEAKLEPADRGDLRSTIRALVSAPTLAESEWLVLGAVLLWAVALGYEALRGGPLARRLAWISTLVVLLSAIPWIAHHAKRRGDPMLVVSASGARVHSEPRVDAAVIELIGAGEQVERLDELTDWTRVELAGAPGWVRSEELFALRRDPPARR